MKKLLLVAAFILVSQIQAHAGCDALAEQNAQVEPQNATQKLANGIFSDQFIKALVTFAKESQAPVKGLLCSTFKAAQLNKEQLAQIKKEIQSLCDLYPKVIMMSAQLSQEKVKQLTQLMEKNFAEELAQNKCVMDGGYVHVNVERMNENELTALYAKMNEFLTPFEKEFDKSPLSLAYESAQVELGQVITRCAAIFPGIAQSFVSAVQANQEQLRMVGMMMLSALSKGVADTVSQAIDDQIQAIKA